MLHYPSRCSNQVKYAQLALGGLALASGVALAILGTLPQINKVPFKAVYVGSGIAGGGAILLALTLILDKKPSKNWSSADANTLTENDSPPKPTTPKKLLGFEGPSPKDELGEIFESWNIDRSQGVKGEARKQDYERIVKLHYRFMNDTNGETPLDFIWSYRHCAMENPIPIIDEPATFEPINDQFYTFTIYPGQQVATGCPLRLPGNEGDAVAEGESFGSAIKRIDNKLYLYLDGISRGIATLVNGNIYEPALAMTGQRLELKEGDLLAEGGINQRFLFQVGPNGTVKYPDPDNKHPSQPHQQSTNFFTLIQNGHIARLEDPIQNGFRFTASADQQNSPQDFIVVDKDKDVVLKKLINYLENEFAKNQYTELQKHARLATLVCALFNQTLYMHAIDRDYLLGEFVRGGRGVCRHRALLYKVLADELALKATLCAGILFDRNCFKNNLFSGHSIPKTQNAGHAWIEAQINEEKWIIDPMNMQAFPKTAVPKHDCGSTASANPHGHPWLEYFYGMRHPDNPNILLS